MTILDTTQAFGFVADVTTGNITAFQTVALAVVNFPSQDVRSYQALSYIPIKKNDVAVVSQVFAMVVVRGLPEYPICRAWTYTLDGHDFYVLNTVNETLVCDLSIEPPSWFVWGSGDSDIWRGLIGNQWLASLPNEESLGSNVLVGDRANGTLYFLNPELPTDDNPDFGQTSVAPFRRVITGQAIVRGRDAVPCFGVEMYGSPPQLYNSSLNQAELLISDDRGGSYVSCGTITVEANASDQRFDWLSLGSMNAPGRLFQVVDYGALTRIDDLDMPDVAKP